MIDTIACPHCGRRLQLPDDCIGTEVACPACSTRFVAGEEIPSVNIMAGPPPAVAPDPAPPRPVPPPRPSGGRILLRLGLAVPVIGFGLLLAVSLRPRVENKPFLPWLADEVPRAAPREPFGEVGADEAARVTGELKPLFEGLGAAMAAHDADKAAARFDLDRLFDELMADPQLAALLRGQRDAFVRHARQGFGRTLAQPGALLQWTRYEIKHVKVRNQEALVIARHRTPNGGTLKMRWWLTRRTGAWRIYDFEDLDQGMRMSALVASLAPPAGQPADVAGVGRAFRSIGEALQALAAENADLAEQKLRQAAGVKLPRPFEAVRQEAHGMLHLHRRQPQPALEAFDGAQQNHGDMPGLDFLKGIAYNQLGAWDKALQHLETYRDLLGEDSVICEELANAQIGLQRFAEARAAYRRALDDEPRNGGAFHGLLRALGPDDDRADLGPRFLKLGEHRANFDTCAADCRQAQDYESLALLAEAMHQLEPEYAPATVALALCRAQAGKPAEAVALYTAAAAKEKDAAKREEFSHEFMRTMAGAGHAAEAYAALPDARAAFRFLAGELRGRDPDALISLLATHARKHPDDPLLPLLEGETYEQEGDYARANKAFATAQARRPEPGLLEQFRVSRVRARYHLGQALAAYAEIGPRHETFRQLAQLCEQDRNDAALETLLDAHARFDPDGTDVPRYRYRLQIRQGKLAQGIASYKALLAKQPTDEKRNETTRDFLICMVDAGKPLDGYRAAPASLFAFQVLAGDLLGLNRLKELELLVEAHRGWQPGSPWVQYYGGLLQGRAGAWPKAAELLAEALKSAPPELAPRCRSAYVSAAYKAGTWLTAYWDLDPQAGTFEQLGALLTKEQRWADLDRLVQNHRERAGDDPELYFLEARMRVAQGKPAEACIVFQKACQAQRNEPRRRLYVSQFAIDMAAAGKPLEAYRAAPDRAWAFDALVRELVARRQPAELSRLLDEYGKQTGAPLGLQRGELLLLQGEPKKAAAQFAAMLSKRPPRDRWAVRHKLLQARVRAGEAAAAYRQFGANARAFEDVAQLCLQEKHAGQLQELLAARRAAPEAKDLGPWDVELCWLREDYAGAVRLVRERRAALLASPRHRWKLESYLVRGLVKCKQYAEAIKDAEAINARKRGDPLLLVFAHAATGDVRATIAAAEKLQPALDMGDCYHDPDLGPLLRGDTFRTFREHFPEPADELLEP